MMKQWLTTMMRPYLLGMLIIGSMLVPTTPIRANIPWAEIANIAGWGLNIRSLWKEFQDEDRYERDREAYQRDRAALLQQLASMQKGLESIDQRMATEIGHIRADLANRVTLSDFRAGLSQLEARFDAQIGRLAVRIDRLDRLTDEHRREIEKLKARFAYLPPVKVSPLLREIADPGRPNPHPLVADYLRLLSRSEVNRQTLARWTEQYQDGAPPIAGLDEERTRILNETKRFRQRVIDANKALRDERAAKLELYVRESHPEVLAVDRKLAALEWLLPLTEPIPEGAEAGRIGIVPAIFTGPQASELVCIHLDHGGTVKELLPIYHQLVVLEGQRARRLQKPSGTMLAALPYPGFDAKTNPIRDAIIDTGEYIRECRRTNQRLATLSPTIAPRAPEVLQLRAQQNRQMMLIEDRSKKLQAQLASGLETYIHGLQEYRNDASNMQIFRQRFLAYLGLIAQEIYVPADANEYEIRAAWQRACDSPYLIDLVTRLDELKADRTFPAPNRLNMVPIPKPMVRDRVVAAAAATEETVRQKRAYEEILLTGGITPETPADCLKKARANIGERATPEQLRDGIRCCTRLLRSDPEFVEAYRLRATAYERLGKSLFAALDEAAASQISD